MKNKIILLLILVSILTGCKSNELDVSEISNDAENKELIYTDLTSVLTDDDFIGGGIISATYGDGVSSLKELKKEADLIITGTVISQENFSEMVTRTEVQVTQTLKGKKTDVIYVREMGQMEYGDILQQAETYILYLRNDSDGDYAIIAGEQGKVIVNEKKGSVEFMDQNLQKDFEKKSDEEKNKDKEKNDYEILEEFSKDS